jgi:hypothetical protein
MRLLTGRRLGALVAAGCLLGTACASDDSQLSTDQDGDTEVTETPGPTTDDTALSESTTTTAEPPVLDDPYVAGSGYEADPDVYLTKEDRATLASAKVPVKLPRWLPAWTKDVTPVVTIFDDGNYQVQWHVYYNKSVPLMAELDTSLLLNVSGRSGAIDVKDFEETRRSEREYGMETASTCEDSTSESRAVWSEAETTYSVDMLPQPVCSKGNFSVEDILRVSDSTKS